MMISLPHPTTHQQSQRHSYRPQSQHGQQHTSPFSTCAHQHSNINQYKQYPTEQTNQQPEASHTDQLAIDCPDNLYLSSSDLEELDSLSATVAANLMQSESWNGLAHFTPRISRFSHQRESSLSSLGSAGPASPFAPTTSNPQIAVTADSANDMLSDVHAHDNVGSNASSYYQLSAKAMGQYAPSYQNMDSTVPELAYPLTIPGPNSKPRGDRGLLPAPEFGNGGSRSHPASVASSVAGGDSPATPTMGDPDTLDKPRRGKRPMRTTTAEDDGLKMDSGYTGVPKLARTITDVYGDELYNPNFAITSTSQPHPSLTTSPSNDVFHQRIHAANSQHLSAAHSPVSSTSRDRSPFRTGSPLAPSPRQDFGSSNAAIQFNSAQRMREQSKAEQDAQLFQQHMSRDAEPETPKTISPKDAILEFHESDAGDANFPLFPQEPTHFDMDQLAKAMASQTASTSGTQQPSTSAHNAQLGFMATHVPQGLQIPQQYPFVARSGLNQNTPPRLSSAGSSTPGSGDSTPIVTMRPTGIAADGGTYTCTYHGCTQRFETPALLQKHKREGHRQQGTTIGVARPHDTGMTSSLVNSQAGPHRCDRINPGTGKPCNTIFSRPYDLTRHEDTIHNARKQKVRCDLCTEEKTFSRADALTRHYRVCHPDVALPGKHRRRGGI